MRAARLDSIGAPPIGDDELGALFADIRDARRFLVAVSGGADSMALMHLIAAWLVGGGSAMPAPLVATVDHGLREESASEAAWVADRARRLNLEHQTLRWLGPKPATGIQAAARTARYHLLAEAARVGGCDTVLLAHTRDDQAETVLMRLARGSGIDGLAAMARITEIGGEWPDCGSALRLARPLLDTPKSRLLATLVARGIEWIEDPSNTDRRFERVRLRAALAESGSSTLSVKALARTGARARRAHDALERWTCDVLGGHAELHGGAAGRIDWETLCDLPDEVALRTVGRLLWVFGGQERPPRLSRLERVWTAMRSGTATSTLGGCVLARCDGDLLVHRELRRKATPDEAIMPGRSVRWDRRFVITLQDRVPAGAPSDALWIGPLGHDGEIAVQVLVRQASSAKAGTQFAWPPPGHVLTRLTKRARWSLPAVWSCRGPVAVPHLGVLPPDMARALPWQSGCDYRFVGEARLWRRAVV